MSNEELLKNTFLFTGINPAKFHDLLSEIVEINVPEKTTFIKEDDVADALYIVKEGVLQVFTLDRNQQDIVLAKLEKGSFFGEQALLTTTPGFRNASVRTLTNSTLLKITHTAFLKIIESEDTLKKELEKIGIRQLLNKLKTFEADYDISKHLMITEEGLETKVFNPGETIISQGDPIGPIYFLLSGQVEVYKKNNQGIEEFVCTIMPNNLFGESSSILGTPRQATIKARDVVRTVVFPPEKFKSIYQSRPELKKIVDTLQSVYRIPKRGRVSQYFGKFQHLSAIINKFNLQDGREVISSRVIGRDIQSIRETNVENTTTLSYEDRSTYRELELKDGRLVGVTLFGEWDLISELYSRVLDKGKLSDEELKFFQNAGELTLKAKEPGVSEEEIICNCMLVSRGTINSCIKKGCTSREEVSKQTGAGTVCGGCIPTIQEMLGRASWQAMHITRISQLTHDTRSYRLFPIKKHPIQTFKIGQHVVIQCEIDGNWIERSYTLTSTPANTEYFEIAVKREEKGLLSRWLFENEDKVPFIRVSSPTGQFMFETDKTSQMICFVAGIGVTPAVAFARAIIDLGLKRPLHLYVNARSKEQLPYASELESFTKKSDLIKCSFHFTQGLGRMKSEDIEKIAQQHLDADFFICGPKEFQGMVKSALLKAGINEKKILIEEFTHAGGPQK